uniref:Uncharacterized protein n=1 Tax=Romanomermis culicivorax TaxID=13658 RepID=A0A915L533_ROMCU
MQGRNMQNSLQTLNAPVLTNIAMLSGLGQVLKPTRTDSAGMSVPPQLLSQHSTAPLASNPNIDCTDSTDSSVNLDLLLAPAPTQATTCNHRNSIAITNAFQVQHFRLEAHSALEQLNSAAMRITNNVLTVQMIDQIVRAISDQLQAQQLH